MITLSVGKHEPSRAASPSGHRSIGAIHIGFMMAMIAFIVFQVAFAMLTVSVAQAATGRLAWALIVGGNLLNAAIGLYAISRRYPREAIGNISQKNT